MKRLDDDQQRLLARALLSHALGRHPRRDQLLQAAIARWCEARWDAAAPLPEGRQAAALLDSIAAGTLPERALPDPFAGAVLYGVLFLAAAIVTLLPAL